MKMIIGEYKIIISEKKNGDMSSRNREKRELFLKKNEIKHSYFPKQIHSNKLIVLNEITDEKIIEEGDAVISTREDIFTGILTADCLPILFFCKNNDFHGAIHAGRKGTLSGITFKTVEFLSQNFESNISELFFIFGPHIKKCCYEIQKDIFDEFTKSKFFEPSHIFVNNNKYYYNLQKANLEQLISHGIKYNQILIIDECTHCSNNYFSYRKGDKDNRFLSIIGMDL